MLLQVPFDSSRIVTMGTVERSFSGVNSDVPNKFTFVLETRVYQIEIK